MNLEKYSTIIFDCDGVILNSNKIKSTAFYNSTAFLSEKAASDLVDYHKKNGGISRYEKFEYFINKLLKSYNPNRKINIDYLLNAYSKEVINKLLICEIADGLKDLREIYIKKKWLVVSGSDEKELNHVFEKRGIKSIFKDGIFGSPNSKEVIFKEQIERFNIVLPAVYIGDSKYDYLSSKKYNIDFIFLYQWTEFKNWENYIIENNIIHYKNLFDLVKNYKKN